jgi:hypothetical protein
MTYLGENILTIVGIDTSQFGDLTNILECYLE